MDGAFKRLSSHLRSLGKGLLLKMRITLRRAWVGMSQKLLHHIQTDPAIHEIAGVRMAQIV